MSESTSMIAQRSTISLRARARPAAGRDRSAEVTTPDRQDQRRRGKNDYFDAQNPAHAAFAHPNRDAEKPGQDDRGVRVLSTCRKTAVAARRIRSSGPLSASSSTLAAARASLGVGRKNRRMDRVGWS